jgi:hypothetical protein
LWTYKWYGGFIALSDGEVIKYVYNLWTLRTWLELTV